MVGFKIKNPNYKSPGVITAEKAADKLLQYMESRAIDIEYVSFDSIRVVVDDAGLLGVTGADLTDGLLHHIAKLKGLEVVGS